MTQKFIDAIEAGNLISVRYSLSNELLLDPRGDSYREMKALAEERLDGLYEPLDGELPQKSVEEYTEPELMELKNDLDSNFSRERLAHYEQVVAIVLREKAEQIANEDERMTAEETESVESVDRENHHDPQIQQPQNSSSWGTAVKYAVAAGAAAFGTAKFVIGTTVTVAASIATGAAVAVGSVVKCFNKNDKEDGEV
jgi:hypothetical protein